MVPHASSGVASLRFAHLRRLTCLYRFFVYIYVGFVVFLDAHGYQTNFVITAKEFAATPEPFIWAL